ncbi:ribonuclease III [Candidatus Parcubacteria bacterium 4484_255]|nr:MAG: ribonuclease III [Candidatus Parcubacteria bacterium 4484_255]
MNNLLKFEKKIKTDFNNKNLLKQALIHRSYINEHPELKLGDNERLEFLGDAVLELIITKLLFKKFPNKPEGELTCLRASLVNTKSLARISVELKIDEYLYLSKGESKSINRQKEAILADVFEAIIGAIYLDKGIKEAEKFIKQYLWPQLAMILKLQLYLDPKSHLQEIAQEKFKVTPHYKIIEEKGPDHFKKFISGVFLGEKLISTGEGKSKQISETNAAKKALKKIENKN